MQQSLYFCDFLLIWSGFVATSDQSWGLNMWEEGFWLQITWRGYLSRQTLQHFLFDLKRQHKSTSFRCLHNVYFPLYLMLTFWNLNGPLDFHIVEALTLPLDCKLRLKLFELALLPQSKTQSMIAVQLKLWWCDLFTRVEYDIIGSLSNYSENGVLLFENWIVYLV